MGEVAVAENAALPAVSASDQMLAMIERASRDPQVDVAKMRELLAMRKEIADEDARFAFDEAMTAAQSEMRPIATDANNPQTKSKYASYLALDKALRPIYTKHGFALSFNTADGAPESYVRVVCDVSRAGHTRRYQIDMPADGKGAKGGDVMTKTHATGAAMTYGQRYLLKMIFNIAVGADDDGNSADASAITDEQAANLSRLITDFDAVESKILAHASKLAGIQIDAIKDMPARVYDRVVSALNEWARNQRK